MEFAVVGFPSQQILGSGWDKIIAVEFDQDQLFASELMQVDLFPHGAGEQKIRGRFADLQGADPVGATQHTDQQQAQHQRISY